MTFMLALALFTGCGDKEESGGDGAGESEDTAEVTDLDGDGFPQPTDCDDTDAAIHPDATELCGDGVDRDCDGLAGCADDDCSETFVCQEDCHDGVDNDQDGLLDCEDGDCADEAGCLESCTNGLDDDLSLIHI